MPQFHPCQSRSSVSPQSSRIARSPQLAEHPILRLQAALGNHRVNRAIAVQQEPIQAKPLFWRLLQAQEFLAVQGIIKLEDIFRAVLTEIAKVCPGDLTEVESGELKNLIQNILED